MSEYVSIREEVIKQLSENMPVIRERYGIETLSIFGSVSRGEDTINSDIDILYTFREGEVTLDNLADLEDYLSNLFHRDIDLVGRKWVNLHFREEVLKEEIMI